eukprot:gene13395-20619_t
MSAAGDGSSPAAKKAAKPASPKAAKKAGKKPAAKRAAPDSPGDDALQLTKKASSKRRLSPRPSDPANNPSSPASPGDDALQLTKKASSKRRLTPRPSDPSSPETPGDASLQLTRKASSKRKLTPKPDAEPTSPRTPAGADTTLQLTRKSSSKRRLSPKPGEREKQQQQALVVEERPWRAKSGVFGSRKAAVVGCSYVNTLEEIPARGKAVDAVEACLKSVGFQCELLSLRDDTAEVMPTKDNVEAALFWLGSDVRPGEVAFFSFAGHSCEVPAEGSGARTEHGLSPCDFRDRGSVFERDVAELWLKRLPPDSFAVLLCDSRAGGSPLDLPYAMSAPPGGEGPVAVRENPLATALPLVDVTVVCAQGAHPGPAARTLTDCFCETLGEFGLRLTYRELVAALDAKMRPPKEGAGQTACVLTSRRKEPDQVFCFGAVTEEDYRRHRHTQRISVDEAVSTAFRDSAYAGRHVSETLNRSQRQAHGEIRESLDAGLQKIAEEIRGLGQSSEKQAEARRHDQTRAEQLWEKEQADRKQAAESWLGLMRKLVETDDKLYSTRGEETAVWSRRQLVTRQLVEEEEAKLRHERLSLVQKAHRQRASAGDRWTKTVALLASASQTVASPRRAAEEAAGPAESEGDVLLRKLAADRREAVVLQKKATAAKLAYLPELDPRVAAAVHGAGASQYIDNVREAELDVYSFSTMTAADFHSIGVTEIGLRIKLAAEAARFK